MRAYKLGLLALPLLSGCSLLPYGPQVEAMVDQAREQGVEDRKKYNDDKLGFLMEAVCDGSIGAASRLEDLEKRRQLFAMCGLPESEQPGSASQLMEALTLMQTLQETKAE